MALRSRARNCRNRGLDCSRTRGRTDGGCTTPRLIESLASEREVVWRAAADEILKRGAQSVPACVAAIPSAPVELRLRLFHVLEQEFLSSEPQTSELASQSLEDFRRGDRLDLSMPADRILNENASLRTSRALLRIQELGGVVRMLNEDRVRVLAAPALVLLDHRWKGGNVGLAHVARLRGLAQLHISPTARLSAAAIDDLLQVQPRTYVVYAGQGCLGVEGEADEFGFHVIGVGPDTPADRGGIQPRDIIVGFADHADLPQDSIPRRISSFAPGSAVRLRIRAAATASRSMLNWGTHSARGFAPASERSNVSEAADSKDALRTQTASSFRRSPGASLRFSPENSSFPAAPGYNRRHYRFPVPCEDSKLLCCIP